MEQNHFRDEQPALGLLRPVTILIIVGFSLGSWALIIGTIITAVHA